MYCLWKAYLEGTVQVTQSRISACDNYKVQVADPAKTVRLQKEQQLRKVRSTLHCAQVSVTCVTNVCAALFSPTGQSLMEGQTNLSFET